MKISSLAAASFFSIALVALTACGGGKSANNAANTAASAAGNAASSAGSAASGAMGSMGSMAKGAAGGTIPNCGAVKAVWVNLNSKVYHEPGDPYYGKTKRGEYLCPSQAKAQGFHRSGATSQ